MARIEIRESALLSDAEYRRLNGWGDDVFGTAHLGLAFRPKDHHFLLYEDGRLCSHVGVLVHTVSADGRDLRVGGLGGVVTVPEAQRRGYARRLMERAAAWCHARPDLDCGLLFCLPRMVPYYARLGWRLFEGPVEIEQPGGRVASPLLVMLLPVAVDPAARAIDLRSLPW